MGRLDAAVGYCEAGRLLVGKEDAVLPYGLESTAFGGVYVLLGQPQRWIDDCSALLQRRGDGAAYIQSCLVFALVIAGLGEDAIVAADGLVESAEATQNPFVLSFALDAYGFAFRDADPVRARDAVRRGLEIAQNSGNRFVESQLAIMLSRLEAGHGDPMSAFDYFTLAIRNFHDSGNITNIRSPLAILAAFFDRLGRHGPAATIAGFAFSPLTSTAFPEIVTAITHLRDVLGDQTYESLARKGETMTTTEIAAYVYNQIDQARTELEHPS
jgi:hypothetical protein